MAFPVDIIYPDDEVERDYRPFLPQKGEHYFSYTRGDEFIVDTVVHNGKGRRIDAAAEVHLRARPDPAEVEATIAQMERWMKEGP